MANNPIIGYDEDGAFAWFPFIAFTVWGGLQAAADPIMNNGNIGDIAREFSKGTLISSVSYLTGTGLAYIAPSTQGMSPLVRYGLKAGYAALTAATTSIVATAMNDFLEDGVLNSSSLKYFNAIKNSVLSSLLISGLSSLNSYLTWDRLSIEAKINTVKKELNLEKLKHKVKIVYDANFAPSHYGKYEFGTYPNLIKIGPSSLESKDILKSVLIHELKHHQDFWLMVMGKDKILTSSLYRNDRILFKYIIENRAYESQMNNMRYLNVPGWFYIYTRKALEHYFGESPLIPNLNHLWFNLY